MTASSTLLSNHPPAAEGPLRKGIQMAFDSGGPGLLAGDEDVQQEECFVVTPSEAELLRELPTFAD